jgi:tetratricopeptide (TPR) repeat protein
MPDDEIQAQDLVKCGKIDEAIVIYQQLKPDSARIFNIIGMLYAERKGDFVRAIASYEKALQIQEEVNIHKKHSNIYQEIFQNIMNLIRLLELHFFFCIERR